MFSLSWAAKEILGEQNHGFAAHVAFVLSVTGQRLLATQTVASEGQPFVWLRKVR